MTKEGRIRIGECWLAIAQMVGRDLSIHSLGMMLDAVADLPDQELERAFNQWVMQSKVSKIPMPAEIREIVKPPTDDHSFAVETASRIIGSISKFGWANPTGAAYYIGPLGWEIVQRFGGWNYICENLGIGTGLDLTTFNAQIRDAAKAALIIQRADKAGLELTQTQRPAIVGPMEEKNE